jgi:hypothetical protein
LDAVIVKIPRSDAMLAALDRVLEVSEEDDNAAWEVPIREFWRVFFADCDARGLCHECPPLVVLLLLEEALLGDQSLAVDDRINYAAAVATIRLALTAARQRQAGLN